MRTFVHSLRTHTKNFRTIFGAYTFSSELPQKKKSAVQGYINWEEQDVNVL
jgi:hypothetical protein